VRKIGAWSGVSVAEHEAVKHGGRRHPPPPLNHHCGVCGTMVFSARWLKTGLLVHVEKDHPRGDLEIVPEFFAGAGLPHVTKTYRVTEYKEHIGCSSFVGRAPRGKVRP
jgi:hypothetical protein